MAIRRSHKLRKLWTKRRSSSLRAKRRGERGLRMETLEERQLLAAGPQLVGIQPNVGELLAEGQTRETAPRELRFLFNSEARIDPASLPTDEANPSAWDSIQITRSGLDGEFEGSSVFSDFGTAGQVTSEGLIADHVTVEFEAVARGQAGSLVQIVVDKAELGEESREPQIEVQGDQIQATLNSTFDNETQARDLVSAINADEAASQLVTARVRSGRRDVDIATPEVTYSPITMPPADNASAISDFNAAIMGLEIQVVADEPGMGGNGIVVNVTQEDLGEDTLPEIETSGKTIAVTLNSNETTPTTAQQLIDTLNTDPEAGELVTASIRSGQGDTLVGDLPINYSPIVLTGASDVRVEPGYLDQGDTLREVVMRFKDHLPDDIYMVEVLGGGPTPLTNTDGEAFEDGGSFQMTFNLDLGAQIEAVVPQPVTRDADGNLDQQRDVIHVYFNNDDLDPVTAETPDFYRLIYTGETVNNADDEVILPDSVEYNADTDMAVLTFSDPIEELVTAGTYRLRIGTDEPLPEAPTEVPVSVDPGSSFSTAMDLAGSGVRSGGVVLSSEIQAPLFPLDYPGGNDEPGHRDIDWIESHLMLGDSLGNPDASVADSSPGIETYYYNFKDEYGFDPRGNVLHNAITEREKQRAREIFDLYANYLGVNFIESENSGFTIVTGDLRALAPDVPTGPGGVTGIAGGGMAIMDAADFQDPGDDRFGGPWFQTAMHEIGHLLGELHTYDLPPLTIQGSAEGGDFDQGAEPVFPGDHDIVHGQHLHRPESNDIDLYRFDLTDAGVFTVETQAQRLSTPSQLDTVLNLYKENRDGTHELIARNDDYFNSDSRIELSLEPGTYFVGVSASGNWDYDPKVEDTGKEGHSEGNYRLRLNFRPGGDNTIVDATGTVLDGNADGTPGGVHNFWFRAAAPSDGTASDEPRTIFVDKANANAGGVETGDGSLANPFGYIPSALDAADPYDIIRLTGNPGEDGDITTLGDNVAYQIGFSGVGGAALQDGARLNVPKDVTVMIDANAILKLRRARIGVGSSSQTLDRSGGALQVMGTPRLIDDQGEVTVDEFGQPIGGSVHFTSLHNDAVGLDFNPQQSPPEPARGDWGGIVFRGDLDLSDSNRRVLGQDGIFLNYVNHADMTYGGGEVVIDGREQAVAPLQMVDERPTLTFNTISMSSDMAMSATPNSFEEDNFHSPKFQAIPFTSDYSRVGPEIHGNTLVENSLNGLFIRVATPAGREIETVTKSTRWDDTDITHIVSENLAIQGRPGGPILEQKAPPVATVVLEATEGGTLEPGSYEYKLVYVDEDGNEGPPSNATRRVEVTEDTGAVTLSNLPRLTTEDPYTARRVYRAEAGTGRFELVARINANDTTFVDTGTTLGSELEQAGTSIRPRLSGRLAVDPGTVVKLSEARIDAQFGAQFISEGVDGRSVVYTSLNDTRYGSGGTFDTNSQEGRAGAAAGDWGGVYLGHLSRGNIDFSTFAYGGGTTKVGGEFAGFDVLEIHQAEVRIANSRFERNADGQGGRMPAFRDGRGSNDEAVIFVRGAQPVIVGNTIVDNQGSAIHINANSLNHHALSDPGRAVGAIDIVSDVNDNQGPLVRGNQLDTNGTNGMTVRGATLTTQGVWDDTDIVHVVRDTITVPDFHTFGGLRLESSPQESLVVKLQGSSAGFTATGQELDITDRIGGSLQIVGQPRFPVVLTSLMDDSVGAGFTPEGLPQTDTNGDGFVRGLLPTGPEVDNGTLIDNDVAPGIPGQFAFDAMDGGNSSIMGDSGVTAQGNSRMFVDENFVFDFTNYLDVGADGNAENLQQSNITTPATLVDDDRVMSEGTVDGQNGAINWHVESHLNDGEPIVYNTITLTSDEQFGDLQFINYLDEDVGFVDDDLLYTEGTPGSDDFRIFTLDDAERVGFSQGGIVEAGSRLVNATYDGWAADQYPRLMFDIEGAGTAYSVPGNIDTTALPPFNDSDLGQAYGLSDVTSAMAWSVDPTATEATITTLLELVPRNPATPAAAGDWRSVRLEKFSNDRNVDVVTEREPSDSTTGPDNNKDPDNAQFIGELAGNLKSGDDRLRLGSEVHGVIGEPGDVDVYSFQSAAGNEIWLDIDRTSQSLDSVVELVDADGNIIAQSDNSYHEELGEELLHADTSKIPLDHVNPLRTSATSFYPESMLGEPKDLWSTNPRDAGMRVVLPGSQGTTNTYYVRVRSSNVRPGDPKDDLRDPDKLNDGLTQGTYQLQVRLREVDEVPGSTVQYADIRYATNGIEVLGQPTHSPLTGEAAEDPTNNNSIGTAQPLGNLLNTERGTIGVSGNLASDTDVDFYEFEVTFDDIQSIQDVTNPIQHLPTILDLDYADGLARANTRLTVFDPNGNVILHSSESNIAGDQPGPLNGTDMDDLDRGSAGTLDPYIGTQELLAGTYYVAVASDAFLPSEFEQFYSPTPSNSLFRLQPITSVDRIAEDHISSGLQSTYKDPQVPVLWDDTSSVPYHLGDVTFFVSTNTGRRQGELYTVDPFTGATETVVGDLGRTIDDIAMRQDGQLHSLSVDPPLDDDSGNYFQIDTGNAGMTELGDDGIETFYLDDDDNVQQHDVGYQFHAMTYGDPDRFSSSVFGPTYMFAVGTRRPGPNIDYTLPSNYYENVLYRFNAETGEAVSMGFPTPGHRDGDARVNGGGTQVVERGHLDTSAATELLLVEATEYDPDSGATISQIIDGLQFTLEEDGVLGTPPITFEFNTGPEITVEPDPGAHEYARDGDTFLIDGETFEFDTGSVIVVEADDGANIDGTQVTITDDQANPVEVTFEYDTDGALQSDDNTPIDVDEDDDLTTLLSRTVEAINGEDGFEVTADWLVGTERITLWGESDTIGATSTSAEVTIEGAPGGTGDYVIPIEETSDRNDYGTGIVTTFESVPGVTVGWDGDRINFMGADTGDFTELVDRDVFTDVGSDGATTAGALPIPFLAEDTAEDLAQRVADQINGVLAALPQSVVASGEVVRGEGSPNFRPPIFVTADDPLRIRSTSVGGIITGVAFVDGTMYAVTNQGGLYIVRFPAGRNAFAEYVPSARDDLEGINFQSLSAGPARTEGGRYEDMLFGMTGNGTIYAFDTLGHLQPAFVDGQTSIDTELRTAQGIAFSTLEENPWRFVGGNDFRGNDPGHGTQRTFDLASDDTNGNMSLHFGNAGDEPNQSVDDVQYDWPGGAHGSMQSNPFSLEGYSPADKPVLYFTYFADTEEQSSAPGSGPMRDSLRVFIGDDTGEWDLLSTNNSYTPDELSYDSIQGNDVQETYDNNTGWRQVRVELGNYAGFDDLRLRVDFSTAGDMNVGDPETTGADLEIVPGAEIDDGDEFRIDGVVGDTFEINMGYSLFASSSVSIPDGGTFQIRFEDSGGNLHDIQFEFDSTGSVSDPTHVPVTINENMSAEQVTAAIGQAIQAQFPSEFGLVVVDNRLNLPNADFVSVSSSGLQLAGAPGTSGIPIEIDAGMGREEITEIVRQALADQYAGGLTEAIKVHKNLMHVIGHTVSDPGPFGLTNTLPGDVYGAFNENLRGQNNDHEGIYLDDFVIGFAERGEVATGASGDSSFFTNPTSSQQILEGPYQLEIRQGEKYGESIEVPPRLEMFRSFDSNDRLSESHTLIAPSASEIADGDTFTLSDGVASLTFEFDDVTIDDGVTPGNVEIDYNPQQFNGATGKVRSQSAAEVAARIRDAINSSESQAVLDITAALADGTISGSRSTNGRVNLFGSVDATLIDRALRVTETTTDANALRDEILGDAFEPVGDATYVGGATSAGFFVGGSNSIEISEGIVLSTGDARFVEGPNTDDGSSGTASGAGDPDLDAEFEPWVTEDSSVLEFDFEVDEPGDLFFEFVFSSEEYNEFVDRGFNDVFGFFVDGENIGFVPGTDDPVTINTINGGNPYGSNGTNEHAYNNNDRDDDGEYLEFFGHDGFTDVFVARMDDLEVGTHTIKLAISDVGDRILDSAVFIRAFNVTAPDSRTALPGVVYTDSGDKNHRRDQGQVLIHSNSVSYAEEYGVRIEPGERSPEGKSHPGSTRATRVINDENLVPGVVVVNNLLARNATGGVYFSGDPNNGQVAEGPVPFGRIVNNTIYGGPEGGGNSVGIRVENNASPTLLNNIVSDSSVGLDIDGSSSSTVVGGTLFAATGTDSSNGNVGNVPLFVDDSNEMFVDSNANNFYLKAGAKAIDSSRDALDDRTEMVTLRQPLGIENSPILAPDRDLYGQRRLDDPDASTPSGLGENVFKDRGAIDRSDFAGPSVVLIDPQDNDAAGIDTDERATYLQIPGRTLFNFSIQVIDGIAPSDQTNGTGPDDGTVNADSVTVAKEGVTLEEGVDYRFGYNATSGIIQLTPLAGIWERNTTYTIEFVGVDRLVLTASSGDAVADGDTFTVTDSGGDVETFEFESGYGIQVPAAGGEALTDGETFTMTQTDPETTESETTRFELDNNGRTSLDNVPVRFSETDTADEVGEALAAAIDGASLGLDPTAWAGGFVHVGGDVNTVLDTSSSLLTQSGLPGVAEGNIPVPFIPNPDYDAEQVAESIASAINTSSLDVTAEPQLGEVVLVGAESATGVENRFVSAIRDRAGNTITPNRFDGSTAFTVSLGAARDYGDAPAQYPVLKADNGASHEIVEGYRLGPTIESSANGQPSPNADADLGDDGVSFSTLTAGYPGIFEVTAHGITDQMPGFLDAWIDFNADGDWDDPGEQIVVSRELENGSNTIEVTISPDSITGETFARFRLSSTGGLSPTGEADDGEVEDHKLVIGANPWHNQSTSVDTNGDDVVSPIDALLVIHVLNSADDMGIDLSKQLPVPPPSDFAPPPFYDVNGDGFVSPIDALLVIQVLNGEEEGEFDAEGEGGGRYPLASTGADSAGVKQNDLENDLLAMPISSTSVAERTTSAADPDPMSNRSGTSGTAAAETSPSLTGTAPEQESVSGAMATHPDVGDEDLEDLLDEIAADVDETLTDEEAHDAFFASLDG
ncbi:MAG: choice-of-anchor L domain-containing protein [Planctomycetota bacterium]